MSYLVLARKWRPQTFDSVVGQKPVVRTLQNALQRGRVAHAMIFSGVRGVGKTTLARLMAKALNCTTGSTPIPCNECDLCKEITSGNAVDLHEIDGASNRGIQEIRELKENIRFFPSRGKYKVIIIDEVHMLTTEAFNALLKTLEEPPEHVIFIFATTELHKIPITILSRCQRYELKRVSGENLGVFFKKITDQEQVVISDWALEQIVREAGGSVRDGLSLLDQIFSFATLENDILTVTDDDITQVLGLVDHRLLATMSSSLLDGDLAVSLQTVNDAYSAGVDLKKLNMELVYYFRSLLICKTLQQPEIILDISDEEMKQLVDIAAARSSESLKHFFHLLLNGVDQMHFSTNPRLSLEMSFIKACQAGSVTPVDKLLDRIDTLLSATPAEKQTPVQQQPSAQPYTAPVSPKEKPIKKHIFTSEPLPDPDLTKPVEPTTPPVHKEDTKPSLSAETSHDTGDQKTNTPEKGKGDIRKYWEDFIIYVKDRKEWMGQALRLCAGLPNEEEGTLVLKFDDPSDCKLLQITDNLKNLTVFAQDFYQRKLQLCIKVASQSIINENGEEQASPQQERRALANDPLVQMALDILDGEVSQIRTEPRFR